MGIWKDTSSCVEGEVSAMSDCCDLRRAIGVRVKQSTCQELMELLHCLRGVNLSTLNILTTFFKA